MSLAYRRQFLWPAAGFVFGFVLASAIDADRAYAAATRLRIKNGHTIRVVLGKRREPAVGVRPVKDAWNLVLTPDLAGSSAELQDITPGIAGSRWVVPVAGDKLVLDSARFLPSHVYRVDIRRDERLLGSTLIYLYPPPVKRVNRMEFRDENQRDQKNSALAPVPKGSFSDGRHEGRGKASR